MVAKFIDPELGNNANDGSSFALSVQGITAGATSARCTPGDLWKIKGARRGSLAGCSISAGSATITLPAGNHKILTDCNTTTGWTFYTNITGSTSTVRQEGASSVQCLPATGFTTGPIARYDLGVDTDLSAFSAITCPLDCGNASQVVTLKLCSDAAGTVVVNTLTYNGKVGATGFHSAMFKNGAPLSSTVRSLVFELSADPATTAIRIDIIAACHDPAVTPNSITPWCCFSTSGVVTEIFSTAYDCSLQAIRHFLTDTTATLLGSGTAGTQTNCVWPHDTLADGTLYIWHAYQSDRLEGSANSVVQTVQEAGSYGSISVYEGGYNTTDMSTQDVNGLTVIIISNFVGAAIAGKQYTELRRCVFIGQSSASTVAPVVGFNTVDVALLGVVLTPSFINGVSATLPSDCKHTRLLIAGAGATGNLVAGERVKLVGAKITNASLNAILGEGLQLEDVWQSRSSAYGIIFTGGSCRQGYNANKLRCKNNSTADLRCATLGVSIRAYDVVLSSATKISVAGGAIICQKVDGVTADVIGMQTGVTMTRDTATVDGTAVASLRLAVTSNAYASETPLYWEGPTYKHGATISGKQVTVSLRIKKSHATNISARMEVKRGIIVSEDATQLAPDDTNWNTVSITFTPTSDGPIEIYFELWSTVATEYIYVNPESLSVAVV